MRLDTERLVIRNWEDRDRDLFHRINSDEAVMAFFPFRRTREEADRFLDVLRETIARRGYGFTALEARSSGTCIGFAGLAPASLEPILPEGTMEIGWRLAPEHWGKGYVTEAARALLEFGFETLGLDEIVSFAVEDNHRSLAVMERLGMTRDGAFDHPRVPDSHPGLRRHVLRRLPRARWQARARADAPAP